MDFKSNSRNVIGGHMKTLLRLLDGVMKRLEFTRERGKQDRETTVCKNTNEWLYGEFLFDTTGSAQPNVKLFEGVGEEGLGNGMAARLALAERCNATTKELRWCLSEKLKT